MYMSPVGSTQTETRDKYDDLEVEECISRRKERSTVSNVTEKMRRMKTEN